MSSLQNSEHVQAGLEELRLILQRYFHCLQKQKKQQQLGSGANIPAGLDPELEAAYQQFGRALGETPRETASIVQGKFNLEQQTERPKSSQATATQPRQRYAPQMSPARHSSNAPGCAPT